MLDARGEGPPGPPGVSVVIATYNRAEQVCDAVASALAQRWQPLEVIVVDDASTDDTVVRLQRLAAGDGRLRVLPRASNGGPSTARNDGILAAAHEFVAFLDSDNRFMADKLARQMPALLSGPQGAVSFSGYRLVDAVAESDVLLDGWDSGPQAVIDALLTACCVNTSTFVASRATLIDVGMFRTDLTCCEDHDLWLRLAVTGHRFLYEPSVLTLYRMQSDSVSADAARVARYEEQVIGDFLVRPDLPPAVAARAQSLRARWALLATERYLDAGMPRAAAGALLRACFGHPRSIRPGWLRLGLRSLRLGLRSLRLGLRSLRLGLRSLRELLASQR